MPFTSKGIEYSDTDKFAYWAFLIYPESAPADFRQKIKDSGLEIVLSPLHENDLNEDGTPKKPHLHGIFHNTGQCIIYKTAKKRLVGLGIIANDYIEPCFHPRNAQRYLIHLDDPEKSQFEGGRNAIEIFNNFPLDLTRDLTKEQMREVRKKVFNVIRDEGFKDYCELLDYLLWVLGDDEMHDYACNHTILFKGYLDSKRNKMKEVADEKAELERERLEVRGMQRTESSELSFLQGEDES